MKVSAVVVIVFMLIISCAHANNYLYQAKRVASQYPELTIKAWDPQKRLITVAFKSVDGSDSSLTYLSKALYNLAMVGGDDDVLIRVLPDKDGWDACSVNPFDLEWATWEYTHDILDLPSKEQQLIIYKRILKKAQQRGITHVRAFSFMKGGDLKLNY
jgi:hypothetical protein